MTKVRVNKPCLECLTNFETTAGSQAALSLHCPNCSATTSHKRIRENLLLFVEHGQRGVPYAEAKRERLDAETALVEAEERVENTRA